MPLSCEKKEGRTLLLFEEGELSEEIHLPFPLKGKLPPFETRDELSAWLDAQERARARLYLYRLLSLKNYSRKALEKKLVQKGCRLELHASTFEELERLGYLFDGELAEKRAEALFRRGYGPHFIAAKLKQEGLEGKEVRRWIPYEREREKIREVLAKGGERRRVLAKLQRRGFDLELLRAEVR